ncbi:thioredoxin-disulfide reductase [Candidatus Purcelliella pentastirinorum]|nr:thioredoxin-disulfide reductase [Candidatus Purcelliella pentastirinorum]WDI78807.1 thioredoxin-disulfide reductase [Candidatus Purcelliella pentastirinorum]WDR79940.1 thioredoxin-disulfide reductase [Candidatus Purcelliella pentastirinorum]
MSKYSKLIILGSGPAGYTAALYSSRANLNPIIITGLNKGGQLTTTNNIENWPGIINPISGTDLMNNMHDHVKRFNVEIIYDHISSVDFSSKPFFLQGDYQSYIADSVIVATGANPRSIGISSEKRFLGKGVSSCATCDGFFYKGEKVAVIGGGNVAIEEVLYLSNICNHVYLIHRRNYFTAEKILLDRLNIKIKEGKVTVYFNYILYEILGNDNGVNGILIHSSKENNNDLKLDISCVFIAIGYIPNTKIFSKQLILEDGYIKVKSGLYGFYTETSISGVFAAGDVIDRVYRQAVTSAATGCMAALDADKYLNI